MAEEDFIRRSADGCAYEIFSEGGNINSRKSAFAVIGSNIAKKLVNAISADIFINSAVT